MRSSSHPGRLLLADARQQRYVDDALPVVRNHVEAFSAADDDVAVAPSGSCVASLRHPPRVSFRNWRAQHADETEDRVRRDGGWRDADSPPRRPAPNQHVAEDER